MPGRHREPRADRGLRAQDHVPRGGAAGAAPGALRRQRPPRMGRGARAGPGGGRPGPGHGSRRRRPRGPAAGRSPHASDRVRGGRRVHGHGEPGAGRRARRGQGGLRRQQEDRAAGRGAVAAGRAHRPGGASGGRPARRPPRLPGRSRAASRGPGILARLRGRQAVARPGARDRRPSRQADRAFGVPSAVRGRPARVGQRSRRRMGGACQHPHDGRGSPVHVQPGAGLAHGPVHRDRRALGARVPAGAGRAGRRRAQPRRHREGRAGRRGPGAAA